MKKSILVLLFIVLSMPVLKATTITETFDDTTFPPQGWTNIHTAGSNASAIWQRVSSGSTPTCTNHSGAGMVQWRSFNYASGNKAILVTPVFDLRERNANTVNVSFWMYRDTGYPNRIDYLNVYVNIAANTTGGTLLGTVRRYTNSAPIVTAAGWYQYTFAVPASYNSKFNYIIFESVSLYGNNIYLDDISYQEFPVSDTAPGFATLISPANEATDISKDTSLNWNSGEGSPTGYKLFLGTNNPPTNMQNNLNLGNTTNYTPSGLQYSTTYYWQVVPYNLIGSATTPPTWSFTTMADPTITSIPYVQDFESVSVPNMPVGWTVTNDNGDNQHWVTAQNFSNKHARIDYNPTFAMNDWFFTPPVQLYAGTGYQIGFNYACASADYPEKLEVKVGTAPNAFSMEAAALFNNNNIHSNTIVVGSGKFTPTNTGYYYFGFHGYSNADMYVLFVDNIRITYENHDVISTTVSTINGSANPNLYPIVDGNGTSTDTDVTITGIVGSPQITASLEWARAYETIHNVSLAFTFGGTNFSGTSFTITHSLGYTPMEIAFRILPAVTWTHIANPGDWTNTTATFSIPGAKNAGDLEVVFPNSGDITLPVTLSYFNAQFISAEAGYIQLNWRTESETGNEGFNIYRATAPVQAKAIKINPTMIVEGIDQGTATSYSLKDPEIESNTTYYYWLENINIDNTNSFYGPVTAKVSDINTSTVSEVTQLNCAYPNPFNPSTYISYSIKDDTNVHIDIFNVKGEKVKTLVNEQKGTGKYTVEWNGKDNCGDAVSSGIYFYKMTTDKYSSIRKMLMLK